MHGEEYWEKFITDATTVRCLRDSLLPGNQYISDYICAGEKLLWVNAWGGIGMHVEDLYFNRIYLLTRRFSYLHGPYAGRY